jgi:hypothetical protein
MARTYPARSTTYAVIARWPHPLAVMIASRLGRIYGHGIDGRTGTIRYDGPGDIQAQRTSYRGYVAAPQIFLGWRKQGGGGKPRVPTPALSSSTIPSNAAKGSPLMKAMATATNAKRKLGPGGVPASGG